MRSTLQVWTWTAMACLSIFRIKAAEGLQYRSAGIAGATTSIFWALIEITVLTVFYTHGNMKETGLSSGLSLQQAVTYAWLAQLLLFMQPMNIDSDILGKINSGDVGIEMCRPLDLYFHWFAKSAAARLIPLIWRGSATLVVGLIMPQAYRLSLPATLAGFLCMLLSAASAFLLCTAFGMFICAIRLNIAWGDGPTYILMLIGGVLSGSYLPLQLWPEFMQSFLLVQPFAGYLDLPLRFYVGTLPAGSAVWAIGLQFMWTALFILLGKTMMDKRLRSIVVQGG